MRGRQTPAVRRVLFARYRGAAILNPADKVRKDRAAREAEAERRAFELARKIERDPNACSVCGARIVDPLSVDRGVGPVCWSRAHRIQAEESF